MLKRFPPWEGVTESPRKSAINLDILLPQNFYSGPGEKLRRIERGKKMGTKKMEKGKKWRGREKRLEFYLEMKEKM
jgi:hypothetical protein